MKVALTEAAERDLADIADFIARDSPARAADFLDELRDSCLGLATMPDRFPLVPRYAALGVRHRVHGNYLLFYRVDRDQVAILHILHGARDYEAVLEGDA